MKITDIAIQGSEEHAERIKKFFKDNGVSNPTEYEPCVSQCFFADEYMEIDFTHVNYRPQNLKLMTIDEAEALFSFNPKTGDKVLVSDDNKNWEERIFIAKFKTSPLTIAKKDYQHDYAISKSSELLASEYMKPLPNKTEEDLLIEECEAYLEAAKDQGGKTAHLIAALLPSYKELIKFKDKLNTKK